MGYNRSGHRRTQKQKRHKKLITRLIRKLEAVTAKPAESTQTPAAK